MASKMKVSARDGINDKRFFYITLFHRIATEGTVALGERFRYLFDTAIRSQLVADVPVGVLLSGGADSSTVAAVASKHQPGVRTFSFGFREGVELDAEQFLGFVHQSEEVGSVNGRCPQDVVGRSILMNEPKLAGFLTKRGAGQHGE